MDIFSSYTSKPYEENPITKPTAVRLEFYENSLDTLNKKITNYMAKKYDTGKEVKELTKAFRQVAAIERNLVLQEAFFTVADRYDSINEKLDTYNRCREQTAMMIDDSKTFLVKPLKDVIGDAHTASINVTNFKKKNPNALTLAPGLEQHLSDATNMMNVSAYLFEKHRVASLRTILINLLHTEMRHHTAAIMQISPILESLYQMDDELIHEEFVHIEGENDE